MIRTFLVAPKIRPTHLQFNAKIIRLHMTRFIIISLVLIFAVHQRAQANSDNHSEDTDNKIEDSYQRGNADGESAGLVDYPYRNSDCPVGHSTAYCLGWTGGYETGFNSQKTDDESNRLNDNENSDNDLSLKSVKLNYRYWQLSFY